MTDTLDDAALDNLASLVRGGSQPTERTMLALIAELRRLRAEVEDLKVDRERLIGGAEMALSELGIPGPGYPSPVIEAVEQLRAAIRDAARRREENS